MICYRDIDNGTAAAAALLLLFFPAPTDTTDVAERHKTYTRKGQQFGF